MHVATSVTETSMPVPAEYLRHTMIETPSLFVMTYPTVTVTALKKSDLTGTEPGGFLRMARGKVLPCPVTEIS